MKERNSKLAWIIISIFGNIASIVALLLLAFSDAKHSLIAMSVVVVCLLVLLIYLIHSINSYIKVEHKIPYQKIASFVTYEIDDTQQKFDSYRIIQSKRPVLSEVDYNFKWSGTKQPKISSDIQIYNGVILEGKEKGEYDRVPLQFRQPLKFNETGVVHFHADLDDHDYKALPFLDNKVDSIIDLIMLRVILKNRTENPPALLQRRLINSEAPDDYETIASVPFDPKTRSYVWTRTKPDVGYYYRLSWGK